MNSVKSGPGDHWYDVEAGAQAKSCERLYYDEQFQRGARQGISVSVDDAVHHFVPAYTLSLNEGPTHLSYVVGDDGALRIQAGDTVVANFPTYDWVEVRERRIRETDPSTPA